MGNVFKVYNEINIGTPPPASVQPTDQPTPTTDYADMPTAAPPSDADVLTVDEVASALRVLPKTIRKWCRDGELRAAKVGYEWRIPTAEIFASDGSIRAEVGPHDPRSSTRTER